MKLVRIALAAAVVLASAGAQAALTFGQVTTSGSFLSLSGNNATHTGLLGTYNITGGSFYTNDQPVADSDAFSGKLATGGTFLAVGSSSTQTATIDFGTAGLSFISFLWGSPDTYNSLTVNYTSGSRSFIPGDGQLGFTSANGNQGYSTYVGFTATGTDRITSLVFNSAPNAFESTNFSITPVPEPETYALMLGGLGMLGFLARRRKSN